MINISPQVMTGKLPSKVVVPTVSTTDDGDSDVKFEERKKANARHYILVAAVIVAGFFYINYKVKEIE